MRGIAHVTASNDHDLFFLQGWVHAGDRLFQMDVGRRLASGTLAELFGPDVLPSDVQFRTLGLRRAAARSLSVLSSDARAILRAYADGVNAWGASHELLLSTLRSGSRRSIRGRRSIPRPSGSSSRSPSPSAPTCRRPSTTRRTSTRASSPDSTAASSSPRTCSGSPPSPMRRPCPTPAAAPRAMEPVTGRAPSPRSRAQSAPPRAGLAETARPRPSMRAIVKAAPDAGSNEWGISAALSASGLPMLANDPHLDLAVPSTSTRSTCGTVASTCTGRVRRGSRRRARPQSVHHLGIDVEPDGRDGRVPGARGARSELAERPQHGVPRCARACPGDPEQFRANVGGDVVHDTAERGRSRGHADRATAEPGPDHRAGRVVRLGPVGPVGRVLRDARHRRGSGPRSSAEHPRLQERTGVVRRRLAELRLRRYGRHLAMFTAGEMPLREDLEAGTVQGARLGSSATGPAATSGCLRQRSSRSSPAVRDRRPTRCPSSRTRQRGSS